MRDIFSKRIIAGVIILVVIIVGVITFVSWHKKTAFPKTNNVVVELPNLSPKINIIGTSVEGRKIESYTYGSGNIHLVFIGGIHGGYEWNSILLAYRFMDYLDANKKDVTPNKDVIPKNMTVTVIPSANPDGVFKVIGKEGRFTIADVPTNISEAPGRVNANNVDLNRNFDCKWQSESTWQNKPESAGSAPFSEPETQAIRDFIFKNNPVAVVFWHSKSNAVYASECKNGILPITLDIMNAYSQVSGYPAVKTFDSYAITGDAEGWLASINIPAITVELQTHETVEWERNLAGIKALFEYYKNGNVNKI